MQKINSQIGLRAEIIRLENKRAEEEKMLKEQFHLAYESMKPINLIKSSFKNAVASGKEAIASPDLKENILNISAGLATGYLSKLLFVGVSQSPLRKLLGFALQFGIAKAVAKNPDTIKSLGNGFLKIIRNKFGERVNGVESSQTM